MVSKEFGAADGDRDGTLDKDEYLAGNIWMNFRFAQPTVSAQQHSRRRSPEPPRAEDIDVPRHVRAIPLAAVTVD
jgi:hypothetical protein